MRKILYLTLLGSGLALDNGLARTPQMGYNSWYDLECSKSMNETTLRRIADAMVAKGLPALGYNYLNLDDCWAKGRHPNGTLFADTATFPSGTLKELADYVHSKGLLFGTYTDRGKKTCAGRPAAQDHEEMDAQTYADWGVDYLKEDSCNAAGDHATAFEQYGKMRDGLNKTGRPVLFSLCGWSDWYAPQGASLGNSWRIGPDDTNWGGILKNIDIMSGLEKYAGAGGWNDPCLLLSKRCDIVSRVTELQTRAQFSMWAVLAAPLLISGTVLDMTDETLQTYSNKEVIAVSQDPLGKQGVRILGDALSGGSAGPWCHDCVPAGAVPCTGAAEQQWEMDSPLKGYLRSATGSCLNVDNCGTSLIVWPSCPTTGCCADCKNMLFNLDAKGWVHSGQDSNPCLVSKSIPGSTSSQAVNLFLGACDDNAPKWNYNASTKTLQTSDSAGQDRCLGLGSQGQSSAVNVWARPLNDGSHSMVFINAGSVKASVTCGPDCFKAIGISTSDVLSVRDLWSGSALPDVTQATLIAKDLDAAGGHLMVIVKRKASHQEAIYT